MGLRPFLAALVVVFIPLAHADDFQQIPCEPYANLEMAVAAQIYRSGGFDLWSTNRNYRPRLSEPNANSIQMMAFPFQETDRMDGRAIEPWRQHYLVAWVQWKDKTCELIDVEYKRRWNVEVRDHVADRCFRYYAAQLGFRDPDIQIAIDLLRQNNQPWIDEAINKVVERAEQRGEGRTLGMFYGQFRLACEREIDQGRPSFKVDGLR